MASITWDSTFNVAPVDTAQISAGAGNIRDTRLGVQERMTFEHYYTPGDNNANHGRHRAGSALAYYQSGTPSAHPDGTSLANDTYSNGRIWIKSDDTHRTPYIYDGTNGWREMGVVPIGAIVAWLPGNFTNSSNGGYTKVIDGSLLPANWKLCDGTSVNNLKSPIWAGASKFLPKLTDERFIQGNTEANAGVQGGSATVTLLEANLPSHNHTVSITSADASGSHVHSLNGHTHALSPGTAASGGSHNHFMFLNGATATSLPGAPNNVVVYKGTIIGAGYEMCYGIGTANLGRTETHAGHTHTLSGSTSASGTLYTGDHSTGHQHLVSGGTGFTGSATPATVVPLYLRAMYIIRIY